ncbi:MAG: hypothetical protein ACW96U_00885 [Candidatus Heimdallarchaeaceae archaeon]|jgi:hypothetical protein
MISCHKCGRSTSVSNTGFIIGVTLRKDPLDPDKYVCPQHSGRTPLREQDPKWFRSLMSSLNREGRRKKKKIINKMKKTRVK